MRYARLISVGSYLPKNKISNDELAVQKQLDTSDAWIQERTGIKTRHIADQDETSLTMAYEAAKKAMKTGNIDPEEIDLIIFATCTPSSSMPSDACKLQKMLNIPSGAISYDINAACSGFVYASINANIMIQSKMAKCALIVGSDKMTSLLNWQDRSTCVLFGDGAGAVIFKADSYPGIMSTTLGADGDKTNLLYTNQDNHIQMNGQEVFKQAVKTLEKIVHQITTPIGLNKNDIDWLIPHQANIRIINYTAKILKIPDSRIVKTIYNHANTSAASIPLALDNVFDKFKRGEHILIEGFGAGFTWGGIIIKF